MRSSVQSAVVLDIHQPSRLPSRPFYLSHQLRWYPLDLSGWTLKLSPTTEGLVQFMVTPMTASTGTAAETGGTETVFDYPSYFRHIPLLSIANTIFSARHHLATLFKLNGNGLVFTLISPLTSFPTLRYLAPGVPGCLRPMNVPNTVSTASRRDL